MAFKTEGNVVVTVNAVDITAYCDKTDLDVTIEQLEATNFASTSKEYESGFGEWKISMGGKYVSAIDALFSPLARVPGTKFTAEIAITDPDAGTTSTYGWPNSAEVANYKLALATGSLAAWSADLQLSGAPAWTQA